MHFNTVLKQLISDNPHITFVATNEFKWSRDTQVISYDQTHTGRLSLLLHELAHSLLDHNEYELDIQLLKKEQEAWQYAENTLAPRYGVSVSGDIRESSLDTYRSWLHQRSLCPDCETSNFQTQTGTYTCVVCRCQWRANKAIDCGLRRYKLSTTRL